MHSIWVQPVITTAELFEEARRQLERKALQLLAPREHAESELRRKLQREIERIRSRHADAEPAVQEAAAAIEFESLLESVLQQLQQRGWQSDSRFAEQLAAQKRRRGHGPLAIRAALERHGLDRDVIAGAIEQLQQEAAAERDSAEEGGPAWLDEALQVLQRRWPSGLPDDRNERARAMRLLARRGFPESICRRALDHCARAATD